MVRQNGRPALLKAGKRFPDAGFEVSGCVTTTRGGKTGNGWNLILCYTGRAAQDRLQAVFEYTAGVLDEIMIDDFRSPTPLVAVTTTTLLMHKGLAPAGGWPTGVNIRFKPIPETEGLPGERKRNIRLRLETLWCTIKPLEDSR